MNFIVYIFFYKFSF